MKYLNDISYKDCVGVVCKSKSSGDFKILKYNNSENVEVQFTNTGFEKSPSIFATPNYGVQYSVGLV